jgi:hypothetical protein
MEIDGVMSRMEEQVAAGHLCPVATEALAGWFAGIEHAPDDLSLVQDSTSRVA